jgi:hypothetical protein
MAGVYEDPRLIDEITDIIRTMERDVGIRLTSGARLLITIPVLETYAGTQSYDLTQFQASLAAVLQEARAITDDLMSGDDPTLRSSLAIIEAFHRRFCAIPPFCRRRG